MPKGFKTKPQLKEQEAQQAYTDAGLLTDKEQQKQEAAAVADTRKRGQPVFRVSVGFTPEVYDYVNTMAYVRNKSLTAYLVDMLAKDREKNESIYQEAKALREKYAKGGGDE